MNILYIILAAAAVFGSGLISFTAGVFICGLILADAITDNMSRSY